MEQITAALLRPECRLLTLLGLGGIGKTRLALAVAEAVAESFPDGVCFVDLTQVNDAAAVPSLLAAQLDLEIQEVDPLDWVETFLSDRHMLLLLDNFEHVLPAAVIVGQILEACPGVTVLVTSREPLQLRWEQRLPIAPLEVPDLSQPASPEELRSNPAVALFVQRARALNMRFEVGEETLGQIATLCVRLGGVPLAIELAAARTTILSPRAILERVEEMVGVLQQRVSDAPVRHQSLQAALDWSYQSLPEQEQAVFRQLAVFVGGFSLEAAWAVVSGEEAEIEVLETLASLVDKSLVVAEPTPEGEPRYRLLETVRSYALEQLETPGEMDVRGAAHARYFVSLAERESAKVRGAGYFVFIEAPDAPDTAAPTRPLWPALLDQEQANLRVALQWAREHDPHALLRLGSALARYWWVRGYLPEGTHWLEVAIKQNHDAEPSLRSRALGGLGIIYRQRANHERARLLLEEAVALTRTVGWVF